MKNKDYIWAVKIVFPTGFKMYENFFNREAARNYAHEKKSYCISGRSYKVVKLKETE
jgi:hypothetical protein